MIATNKKRHFQAAITLVAAVALSACNSTDSTLGVDTAGANANQTAAQAAASAATPRIAGFSSVYFSPIVGAPVSSVTALSRRLSSAAETNKIQLQPSASTSIDHEIRGYFSALSEDGVTTVIHVWDVFLPQGQRVHRIQGQEKVTGSGTDPWSVVPASTMEGIADQVLSQYAAWRSTS